MSRLIKLQIRNVFYNKMFYVCLGLTLLMSPILTFIISLNMPSTTIKVFPEIISFMAVDSGLISAIFIALFFCFDFSEGTTKNIIARGYTRTQLLISKYVASFVGVAAMHLASCLLIFILFINNGLGYEDGMIYSLINSILYAITYLFFYGTMSFLLEKNGSAIVACIFVPSIIPAVLGLIDTYFKINIAKFWIDNLSNKLIEKPSLANLGLPVTFYIIYIIAFIAAGIYLSKRKEIK